MLYYGSIHYWLCFHLNCEILSDVLHIVASSYVRGKYTTFITPNLMCLAGSIFSILLPNMLPVCVLHKGSHRCAGGGSGPWIEGLGANIYPSFKKNTPQALNSRFKPVKISVTCIHRSPKRIDYILEIPTRGILHSSCIFKKLNLDQKICFTLQNS